MKPDVISMIRLASRLRILDLDPVGRSPGSIRPIPVSFDFPLHDRPGWPF
jgi:hypothetical protein